MRLALPIGPLVALDDALQAQGHNLARNHGFHLYQDEAALAPLLVVQLQDGVPGAAAAGKGIQRQVAGLGGDLAAYLFCQVMSTYLCKIILAHTFLNRSVKSYFVI